MSLMAASHAETDLERCLEDGEEMRKQHQWRILCFVFSLVFLADQADSQQLTVSGEVRGAHGDAKKFVRVQLEGPKSYISLTDANGNFSVGNVIPGRYLVTVTQGDNVQRFPNKIITADLLQLNVPW